MNAIPPRKHTQNSTDDKGRIPKVFEASVQFVYFQVLGINPI